MRYFKLLILILLTSCSDQRTDNAILSDCHKLKALTHLKQAAQPGEWRSTYAEVQEPLNTYWAKHPPTATNKRSKLYVVQLGTFDKKGKQILEDTKGYLEAFYQIQVAELPPIPVSAIPEMYTRRNSFGLQFKTSVILDSLLPSLMPDSAFALIGFSLYDLYPDNSWNFVFGQASLKNCVGIWSMARLGNYNLNDSLYILCRQRTMNVAVHETGHIFGIKHCVQNECCMNGSNSLSESDKQPTWLCWECLAKVCMNRNIHPKKHIAGLLAFHNRVTKDKTQTTFYNTALHLLKQ
jgi:archaemetzincin